MILDNLQEGWALAAVDSNKIPSSMPKSALCKVADRPSGIARTATAAGIPTGALSRSAATGIPSTAMSSASGIQSFVCQTN